MVSLNKQDGERERYSEDHSFMSGFYLGEAGEIQGQDIVVGGTHLSQPFCLCILINCFMTALLKLVTFIVA